MCSSLPTRSCRSRVRPSRNQRHTTNTAAVAAAASSSTSSSSTPPTSKHTPVGKLFASSSFYSPGLHPTVEDQVELARRISHSLSDTTNHTSKGQSMYVNRKKKATKWVHEGGEGN